MKKPSICFVLTSPFAVNGFMLTHFKVLSDFFSITLIVNTHEYPLSSALDSRVSVLHCDIARNISLWKDIKALFWLIRLFCRARFDLVHSITPKAGLLAMSAAWAVAVPVRIHTFTGQVWVTQKGLRRGLLKRIDQFISAFATRIHADSQSQLRFLVQEQVIPSVKAAVIGAGSISGVDLARFRPNSDARALLRQKLGISVDAVVFIFLGRITRDKGVVELATAFRRLACEAADAVLIIAGPDEGRMESELESLLQGVMDRVVLITHVVNAEDHLAAADVLVIPSYREGFGTVVLEAAAVGLPAIGSRIYGLTDAIIDNQTGVLTAVRDVDALHNAMSFLLSAKDQRQCMGAAAMQRVNDLFSAQSISSAWHEEYQLQLNR